jgi:CheY-like chemotaxis protein
VFSFTIPADLANEAATGEAPDRLEGLAVLLVMPEGPVRPLIARMLKEDKAHCLSVPDIGTALDILSLRGDGERFSHVLWDLPRSAPVPEEQLAELKSLKSTREAHFVLLSAAEQRGRIDEMRQLGFESYLIKPVRRDALIGRLSGDGQEPGIQAEIADGEGLGLDDLDSRPLRVLLAEDNQINALLATALLTKAGHDIDVVANGGDAVERALSGKYDLVFMDIHMPGMDGFEATRRIRAQAAKAGQPHLPIVALTANAMADDKRQCLEAGMDDFLTKPIEIDALKSLLERWCPGESPRQTGT